MRRGAPRRAVVVGASIAGLSAARELRESGFDGEIQLLGAERHLPYDRTALSKALLLGAREPADIALASGDDLDRLAIAWRPGARAVALRAAERRVLLSDGASVGYDVLVIATGATARELDGLRDVAPLTLRTLDDALDLRVRLAAAEHVAIVGAGFVGCEVAAAARALGHRVTLLDPAPAPLVRVLGPEVGCALGAIHRAQGVDVRCGVGVVTARERGGRRVLELSDGSMLAADAVVVGVGARPATDWLGGSGLALQDGVLCDDAGGTRAPGVVAVGDVARFRHPALRAHVRVEHYGHAAEHARAAAARLLEGSTPPFSPVPLVWSEQYDHVLHVAGLPGPGDRAVLLDGALDGGAPFVCAYLRGDRVSGIVALDRPRDLRRLRGLVHGPAAALEPERARPAAP